MVQSAGLSVCPPVTHFSLCSHHRIIITRTKKKIDDCDPNRAFPDCNYSSSWIHRRLWNDAQRLEGVGRGSLLCFKVLNQISMSHGPKNQQFHGFGSGLNKITRPVAGIKSLIFALLGSCYLCKYRYQQSLSVLTTDWTHTNRSNTFYQTVI